LWNRTKTGKCLLLLCSVSIFWCVQNTLCSRQTHKNIHISWWLIMHLFLVLLFMCSINFSLNEIDLSMLFTSTAINLIFSSAFIAFYFPSFRVTTSNEFAVTASTVNKVKTACPKLMQEVTDFKWLGLYRTSFYVLTESEQLVEW